MAEAAAQPQIRVVMIVQNIGGRTTARIIAIISNFLPSTPASPLLILTRSIMASTKAAMLAPGMIESMPHIRGL